MAEFFFRRHHEPMAIWSDAEGGYVPFGEGVVGGIDVNGETLYVGRALQEGDCIPGKIVPSHGVCYISYAGREVAHRSYQVLKNNGVEFVWVPSNDGATPTGAVQGGMTMEGEPLYIGRSFYSGSHCVGKIHPSHGKLYIPFAGEEIPFDSYEVLCIKNIKL